MVELNERVTEEIQKWLRANEKTLHFISNPQTEH